MSADKRKKKQRAFAFLRNRRRWIKDDQPQEFYFTGPPSNEMRWLVAKGFAVISRRARSYMFAGRNIFTELS